MSLYQQLRRLEFQYLQLLKLFDAIKISKESESYKMAEYKLNTIYYMLGLK